MTALPLALLPEHWLSLVLGLALLAVLGVAAIYAVDLIEPVPAVPAQITVQWDGQAWVSGTYVWDGEGQYHDRFLAEVTAIAREHCGEPYYGTWCDAR
jgi:hypothetical protein